MSTTLTPPAGPAGPQEPRPGAQPTRRTAARVIAGLVAALGVAALVATVWSGARPTFAAASARSETTTAAVAGVDALAVDVSAARLSVRFDDAAATARLDVRDSGGGSWTLRRDGDTLRVATPRSPFAWGFGGGNGTATLTLPSELAGLGADLHLGGGSIDVAGEFGDVTLDMAAGQTTLAGTARALTADISAGRTDLDLADVATADVRLSAGELRGALTGDSPQDVRIDVSAGTLNLQLPDDEYAVTSEVSAGGFDNRLRTDPGASARVDVQVSAGNATLRAG
jgi:hypothetical protein